MVAVGFIAVVAGCSTRPKDYDMLVWTKPGWDPRQEDKDYSDCLIQAKAAAYRKFHWRRQALSKEVDHPSENIPPSVVLSRLQDIALDEKVATVAITEECMATLGYELVPVDRVRR